MLLKHNKFQLRVYLLVPRSCLCFNVSYTFFSGSCYSALPPPPTPSLSLSLRILCCGEQETQL